MPEQAASSATSDSAEKVQTNGKAGVHDGFLYAWDEPHLPYASGRAVDACIRFALPCVRGKAADTMDHDMNPPLNLFDPDALPGNLPMEPATAEDLQGVTLAQLIRRMAHGDEAALAHLYDLTLSRVHALALRITARRDLAEEVCIESYWQAWREAVRYDAARGQPLAWLMVMVRSRALDALRRLDRAIPCADPETYLDGENCPDGSPLDRLMAAEQSVALGRALAALTPVQRQIVALAFYKDLSHQHISDHTGLPLGTVKSHLKRAQDTLRIALCQA